MLSILALIALPLVLFTLFIPTTKGIRMPIGSFILLKKFIGKPIKVWHIKDPFFLILRILFALSIALLIVNPLNLDAPKRFSVFHPSKKAADVEPYDFVKMKFVLPQHIVDRFNEDVFFLESFVRSYDKSKNNVTVYYDPSVKDLAAIQTDAIIFPALYQDRAILEKITNSVYYSALESREVKVRGYEDIHARIFYPIIIAKKDDVSAILELEDGTVVAASFKFNGKNILVWGLGLSAMWGDLGLSGNFIDIIDKFLKGSEIVTEQNNELSKETGAVTSVFNKDLLITFALLAFSIEIIVFILRLRAVLILVLLFAPLHFVFAEDLQFIEGIYGDSSYTKAEKLSAFSILKSELEKRASVTISPKIYSTFDFKELEKGNMPELPYLFIFGCSKGINVTKELTASVKNFISRGGIIFSDSCGADKDIVYNYSIEQLAMSVAQVADLPQQHPLFRSFYLVFWEHYKGIDVSLTTRRTAFIISRSGLINRLQMHDEKAIRSSINVVLYMLSGNYKSDQLHVRHILKRLQKRELFKND